MQFASNNKKSFFLFLLLKEDIKTFYSLLHNRSELFVIQHKFSIHQFLLRSSFTVNLLSGIVSEVEKREGKANKSSGDKNNSRERRKWKKAMIIKSSPFTFRPINTEVEGTRSK